VAPRTVLAADFIVSMPKVKTHHWAGVTLSLKNMFGVVPGVAYGWPKNILHWKGIGRSILDINALCCPISLLRMGSSPWKEMAHCTDPQKTSHASCYLTIPWPLISAVPGSWD
jgi:hypothetical protein